MKQADHKIYLASKSPRRRELLRQIGIAYRPRARVVAHWVATRGGVTWVHVFGRFDSRAVEKIERAACSLAGQRCQTSA